MQHAASSSTHYGLQTFSKRNLGLMHQVARNLCTYAYPRFGWQKTQIGKHPRGGDQWTT